MKRFVIVVVAVAFGAMSLVACDRDRASTQSSPPVPICDGSSGVRLAVAIGGGGQTPPGTAMLAENGWQFLLVEGTCAAWILPSDNEPLRSLTLSRDQERQLASALRPSEWSGFDGLHQGGCPDAPGISYRFDQQRINGATCGLRPGDPLLELNTAFGARFEELTAAATDVSGDMRYLVLRGSGAGAAAGDNRAPVPWPLDVAIESVALTEDQAFQYMRGGSKRATGNDASKLRAIRTTARNGSANAGNGLVFDYTLVVAADGVVYQLFARDSVPLEGDDGLLPPATF